MVVVVTPSSVIETSLTTVLLDAELPLPEELPELLDAPEVELVSDVAEAGDVAGVDCMAVAA